MKILAIETATEGCSAALYLDGEVRERFAVAPREHSRLILEMMQALLAEAGLQVTALDALAFGRGPGSFTGVRIAAAVVQGTAYAAELPVAPVSTLVALAQGCGHETGMHRVLAAIDARMQEVYWAPCEADEHGLMAPVGKEEVTPAARVQLPDGEGWGAAGSGWGAYGEVLTSRLGDRLTAAPEPDRLPHARDVAVLGAAMAAIGDLAPPERAVPVYLRDHVARKMTPLDTPLSC